MRRVILLLLACGLRIASALPCRADVDMAGLKCTLTFVTSADTTTTITITKLIGANAEKYDGLDLYEFTPFFGGNQNPEEVCKNIGTKVRGLSTGSQISERILSVPSFSEASYIYRAIVLTSSHPNIKSICASVRPRNDTLVNRRAKFMGPNVIGTLWMSRVADSGIFITGELSFANDKKPSDGSTNLALMMYSDNCKGFGTAVGSMTIDVPHSVAAEGRFVNFLSTVFTPSAYLGLTKAGSVVACTRLRTVGEKTVTAVMNWQGVKGYIKFTQESVFFPTKTEVHLTGLKGRTKGYHVHKYPVPQRLSASENRCAPEYVSGHFNPYGVDATGSPAAGTGTDDQYEIGDLSGKYGTLEGLDSISETYTDENLPLFGPNSIVGRSIVIHNSDGSRLLCGNIGYPTKVTTAVTVFKSPIYGTMYFRQDANDPDSDTSVFIELASQNKMATMNHNWHVHVYQVNSDAFNSEKPCASAGPHYNPTGVSVVDPPYKTACSIDDPLRCELGDLSRRLGKINIAVTQRTEAGKFFFTDQYLPLSGPYSVLRRSMVVHAEGGAAARYACANITQLQPIYAKTDSGWKGRSDGTVTGQFTFMQATEFDLTKVTGSVTGLAGLASGYHIHKKTIANELVNTEDACDPTSVAGHYNPFNWTLADTLAPTVGTFDHHEVGDLSNKYGLMDNVNSYQVPEATMDTNLPLFTSLASMDKSIVIHKKEAGARWKCTNFFALPVPNAGGHVITATVRFNTVEWAPDYPLLSGTIRLRQVVYEDGGSSPTSIEIDVAHVSNPAKATLQHNWHVHINPIMKEDECSSALGHYDPYGAADNKDYKTDCNSANPLFCEVGDLSNKQAKYDIGGGRVHYHDVDTPLHTEFTVLGRSIVFHVQYGGADRYACSNIIPDRNTYTLAYPFATDATYDSYKFTTVYANALGISRTRLVVLHNIDVPVINHGCAKVMVHIAGGLSSNLESSLLNGYLSGLGYYASTADCPNDIGAKVVATTSGSHTIYMYNSMILMISYVVVNFYTKIW